MHSSAGLYGADLQLAALAGALRGRGWDVAAVLPEHGELGQRLADADVEVVVRPLAVLRRRLLSSGGVLRLGYEGVRERRGLASLARDCAVVHSNTSVIVGGGAAAAAAGVPHVMHVREIYAGAASGIAARAWPMWRQRLLHADALVCVSEAVAEQFDWPDNAVVVRDGLVRPKLRHFEHRMGALDDRASPFAVAVLGRIADWKGQDVLVRALADPALAEIGAIGVIAGDAYPGERAPDIGGLARQLGIEDRVRMLGFRSNPEEVLASVDAVAVPSTRPDPLPNSAIEALAAGKPVVAAAHGGLPEIVKDHETGILVRPGDPRALAGALRRLADDPELRRRMGEAAVDDANERFGLSRMVDEVERVYARLGVTQ